MRDQVERIVAGVQADKLVKGRAEYDELKRLSPMNWLASQPFDEGRYCLGTEGSRLVVEELLHVARAAKACDIIHTASAMKGYTYQFGGQAGSQRKAADPCCSGVARHGVYVDMGLTLNTPGWTDVGLGPIQGREAVRLSGDPGEVHETVNDMTQLAVPPTYVRAICPSVDARTWWEVRTLFEDELAALKARYDELVVKIAPDVDRFAERYSKKLARSRARSARPDNVAKREAEARTRARESLSQLMCGSTFQRILDRWSAEELLKYLRLCQTESGVLKELMLWSSRVPLGSKQIALEDVEVALELAKVRGVMES
jgi:hypothetical protein